MVADSRYLRKRVVASFKSRVVTLTTVFAYNSLMVYLLRHVIRAAEHYSQ